MRTSPGWWPAAGIAAGVAGLATSYCATMVGSTRDSVVAAVAEGVIRLLPGGLAETGVRTLGHHDKPVLVAVILVLLLALFAWAGWLARTRWWAAVALLAGLAVVGAVAVVAERGSSAYDPVPVVVGFLTWVGCLALLTAPLRAAERAGAPAADDAPSRREFLVRAGVVLAGAAVLATVGRVVGGGRRKVEEARRLLRLPGVTVPVPPPGTRVGLRGVTPWVTPADRFYRVDTSIVSPAVEPGDWRLRIHGLVDREVRLTYRDLLDRELTEAWVTLSCVSNEVGGDLVGNAWWSGVRIADLLAEAGVRPGADAVLQTSDDGWTCGTPLTALTDGRNALLAVAMNGDPLPIEHGFPVRAIVPGLYGYVSACKWVVDLEVTRFDKITAYWTERGWAEQGPVKLTSRIDVPHDGGQVAASGGRVGGVAWCQHTGISAVEVAVDGGAWTPAQLGRVPGPDTWVQWAAALHVEPGFHTLQVRATDADGRVQTGEQHEVLPDGATGWHTIRFEATADQGG